MQFLNFSINRFTLFLVALSVLGSVLVLLREINFGVFLHWDSVNYIFVARNMLDGDFFHSFPWGRFTLWAPLYPITLAIASMFVFDPHDVAGPLNAIIFGLTIFVSGNWLRDHLESRFMLIWACLSITFAVPLSWMASWVMSESAFILLTTISLIQIDRFLSDSGKQSSLVWCGVFVALACLMRYMGVTLVVAVVVLLIFQRGAMPLEKLRRLAIFSVIAMLPISIWMLRNFILIGEPTGYSPDRISHSLPEILRGIFAVRDSWLFLDSPLWDILPGTTLLTGLFLLGLAISVGYVGVRFSRQKEMWDGWRPVIIFGTFALSYVILLIVAMMTASCCHGVQPRYLTPIYLPLLFLAVFAVDRFLSYERDGKLLGSVENLPIIRTASLSTIILIPLLSLWLGYQAMLNISDIRQVNAEGIDISYNNPTWADSEVLEYIRESPVSTRILTNVPAPVYIYTDGSAVYSDLSKSVGRMRRQIDESIGGEYVVWFHDWYDNPSYGYTALDLRTMPQLETVASLQDGIILKIDKDSASHSDPYQTIRSEYEAVLSGGEPIISSDFDIYADLDQNALFYIKSPCALPDTNKRFFLHVIPENVEDLAQGHIKAGFTNLDFTFAQRGLIFEEKCFASVTLPNYNIKGIRTGQWIRGEGNIWSNEFYFNQPPVGHATDRTSETVIAPTPTETIKPTLTPSPPLPFNARVAKWFGNRAAAISITHDDGKLESDDPFPEEEHAADAGLAIDYEMVTELYLSDERVRNLVDYIRVGYGDKGFSFFGHGHRHIDHDPLSYQEALESFRSCYEVMESIALKPVAYAYPRNSGWEQETQRALEDAGFLSGRLQTTEPSEFYNVSGAKRAPDDWFALKALPMESFDFAGIDENINENSELVPILDEALSQTAWIILTYHSAGDPDGYGFYDGEEFKKDMQSIAERDFWNASMNIVTLYVREREKVEIKVEDVRTGGETQEIMITLSDGLENTRFNQQLTLLMDLPSDWIGVPLAVSQDGETLEVLTFDTQDAMFNLLPNEHRYVISRAEQ